MSPDAVMDIFREGILVAAKLSAPILIVSIGVGLIIAIFQAATQIHEQTLTFAPKLLAIALVLMGLGSWMMTTMLDFIHRIFQLMGSI